MKKILQTFLFLSSLGLQRLEAQKDTAAVMMHGLIPAFALVDNEIKLERLAQANLPFDKVGRKFAILGLESGTFEAWAFPLKLLRNCKLSFFLQNSTRPLEASDVVRSIAVTPEATVITYVHQSFTVRAMYLAAVREPGALVLLDVSAVAPLKIVCSFIPVLQPMWPAGIGGQSARWDKDRSAYLLSEPTRQNHGIIGSPAATGISYAPAHMLSDHPYEFPIEINNPEHLRGYYIPIIFAGGKGVRDSVIAVYNRLAKNPERYYQESVQHFSQLEQNTLQIQTPFMEINRAFQWAKVAYDNLMIENPDLGKGLVAGFGMSGTSGRPGFGWFFGGDAFINSFSINSYNDYQTVKDALRFTQKWQRQDGKMAHELTQAASYVDWFGKYPYGYIHGDTTPFYLAAMYDYFVMTADTSFILESWNSLERAYSWCLSTDANNDGLMDNRKAGLGALEFGALTNIESDVYLAAVGARAAYSMHFLAKAVGKKSLATQAENDYKKTKGTFEKKFWDPENRCYTYAFNEKSKLVKEITPWSAVGLFWGLGDSSRSLATMERLSAADMSTDWGVRTISDQSSYYDPLNYNYGTVWPFVTSWVSAAMYKHHLPLQGYQLLLSSVRHTFDHQLGTVAEVFSGNNNIPLGESVAHQGFSSAGVVLPLVRGLLGLEGSALEKKIVFAPHLPADWDSLDVTNYRVGNALYSFKYVRERSTMTLQVRSQNASQYAFEFSPTFSLGTEIQSVQVNGKAVSFSVNRFKQVIQPLVVTPLGSEMTTVVIQFEPPLELLPTVVETEPGEENKGLKFISMDLAGKNLVVEVDGLSGTQYKVRMLNPEKIARTEGASVERDHLILRIPHKQSHEFVRHRFTITLK